jgi:hypothetical protein
MVRKIPPAPHFVVCQHCGRKYRAISVFHLRAVHGYDGEHPVQDYKSEFGLRFAACDETRSQISEAKECFWEERGQHWTPADVVEAIRRIYRDGGCLRRNMVPVGLYEVARRLFGTWAAAVEAAGLPYEEVSGVRRWSKDKVIRRIQELAAQGVPLHATYVREHYPFLLRAAIKLFPRSWAKALRAAGLDPEQHRMPRGKWTREIAATWVLRRVARPKPLLARHVPRDLVRFVHRRLAMTWGDFLESLGIPYPGIKRRRDWTKEKLLDEIRRWHAEGHALNYQAVYNEYQALIHQARKFCGNWDRARAEAGV